MKIIKDDDDSLVLLEKAYRRRFLGVSLGVFGLFFLGFGVLMIISKGHQDLTWVKFVFPTTGFIILLIGAYIFVHAETKTISIDKLNKIIVIDKKSLISKSSKQYFFNDFKNLILRGASNIIYTTGIDGQKIASVRRSYILISTLTNDESLIISDDLNRYELAKIIGEKLSTTLSIPLQENAS